MLSELDILEQKITKLLDLVDTLKQDKTDLKVKLEEKEGELRGLKDNVENLQVERDHIKQKVSHLIESVEDF